LLEAAGSRIVAAGSESVLGSVCAGLCCGLPLPGPPKGQENGDLTGGRLEPIEYWRRTGLEPYGQSTEKGRSTADMKSFRLRELSDQRFSRLVLRLMSITLSPLAFATAS